MPERVRVASRVLGQHLAVVLSQDAGRALVDELVRIGRVPADRERDRAQVRAILRHQPEEPPRHGIPLRAVCSLPSSQEVENCLLSGTVTIPGPGAAALRGKSVHGPRWGLVSLSCACRGTFEL